MPQETFTLQIRQIRLETDDVLSFELASPTQDPLPVAPAGAHLELHLPGALQRSYSLLDEGLGGCYRIAVKREPQSRGGSAWLHSQARVGQTLQAQAPRNDFALNEHAPESILIAGGIGITPLLAMARRLNRLGHRWSLHYAAPSPDRMAYRDCLQALAADGHGSLHTYCSSEDRRLDIAAVVRASGPQAHLYCCGPAGLIDDFITATQDRPPERVHYERFAARHAASTEGGYEALLARSGKTVKVSAGRTLLDAILDAGVDIPYACSQGVCGTCRTRVISGTPDHRDECLTEAERQSNEAIIPCCSGALSSTLVLDL